MVLERLVVARSGCRACWRRAAPARASAAAGRPAPGRPAPGAVVASTRSSTRSASAIASSAWRTISLWKGPSSPASTPPVSISANRSPPHSTTSSLRSRVTPGSECTTVSRVAVRRLTSVDLPAFGSPTIATVPSSVRSACRLCLGRRAGASCGSAGLRRSCRHSARRRLRGRAAARRRWPPACGAAGARARAGARPSSRRRRRGRPVRAAPSRATASGGPNMTVTGCAATA